MRLQVWSLASLSGLRIRCYRELWCRLQTWLGSRIAVAVTRLAAAALIQPLTWDFPHALGVILKRQKERSSRRGAEETNPTRNHEVVGLIPALAQWVNDLALP